MLAAVALLVQAMMPSVAVAMAAQDGAAMVQLCSGGELKSLADKQAPKGFAGMKCAACVAASLAGAVSLTPPLPVRMGVAVQVHTPLDRNGAERARSPPRIREQSPRAPPEL